MNKNQKILRWVFVIFTTIVVILAIDMARNTTAPWNKKKQLVRAWEGDSTNTVELSDTTKTK
ncbi:hypothetical protein [Flectobacillus longus]|uniref:hypothetical protein n=1 Tax=Flectobacillus longus TaxID=2984207 RepID=UPI0024B854BF|nr:hypothetical protein [Flectobacillus longus]MDI9879459.1 hypothetical protein [Flectobacillus longus]